MINMDMTLSNKVEWVERKALEILEAVFLISLKSSLVGGLEDNHQEDEDLKEEVIFVIICPFHYSKLSLERNHK